MPKPKPAPTAYPEQPPGGWTIEKDRAAIADLEGGWRIEPAYRLMRACSRSSVYCLARDQVIETVLGLPLEVLPAGRAWEGRGLAATVASAARDMLSALLTSGCERWLIEYGKMLNLAIGVLSYDTSGERWDPVSLMRWPLSAVRLDPVARKMYALTMGGIEEEITPGQNGWVVFAPGGLWNWDAAMVRCLAEPWTQEVNGMRDLGNRVVRDSVAGLLMPLPAGVAATDQAATDYMEAAQGLQEGRAGLMYPASYVKPEKIDLSSANASTSFAANLAAVEYRLKVGWLGQDGTTTNAGGSLAKTVVLNGVLYDKVESIVRETYGQLGAEQAHEWGLFTSQIVAPWALLNWGRSDVTPLVRRIVPDLEEGERRKQDAAGATEFRKELSELKDLGFVLTPKNVQELQRVRGVRLPDSMVWEPKGTPEPPPPPPPPAPAAS